MTNREFYEAIAKDGAVAVELREFAAAAVEKMDKANEKRKNTPSKTAIANQPLMDYIEAEVLSELPITASDVAAKLTEHEGAEVKVQKASALLRKMVTDGRAAVEDVKVPKKGTVKGYTKVSE